MARSLHGDETRVWGDQAYRGQGRVLEECAPQAQDFTCQRYRYKDRIDEVERAKNRTKAKVRSKVEHVFAVMKLKFGFVKVRYRGIAKNANRLFATCALVNLFLGAQDTAGDDGGVVCPETAASLPRSRFGGPLYLLSCIKPLGRLYFRCPSGCNQKLFRRSLISSCNVEIRVGG